MLKFRNLGINTIWKPRDCIWIKLLPFAWFPYHLSSHTSNTTLFPCYYNHMTQNVFIMWYGSQMIIMIIILETWLWVKSPPFFPENKVRSHVTCIMMLFLQNWRFSLLLQICMLELLAKCTVILILVGKGSWKFGWSISIDYENWCSWPDGLIFKLI